MMELSIACPLCSQPGFPDVNTLWFTLIRATTRQLACPVCHEVLCGLDKLTIHLVSHSLHDQLLQACVASNLLSTPSTCAKSIDLPNLVSVSSQDPVQVTNSQSAPVASYVLINLPSVGTAPVENSNNVAVDEESKIGKNIKSGPALPCPDTSFPVLVDSTAKENSSASNRTTLVMPQTVSTNGNEALKFMDHPHPSRNKCNYSNISYQTQIEQSSSSSEDLPMWNQSSSQYELQISRSCSESFNSKLSNLYGANPEPKSVTEEVLKDCSPQTPNFEVSCGICGLSFKDNNIALLHQQLIHNLSPRNENPFLLPSKTDERNASKQRPKRTIVASQSRDGAGSLHRFPCHICNKVFRMRGSLMVHLRVAHSPSVTVGLASRLGGSFACSKLPSDVIGKLPMQNLSLKDTKSSFASQEELPKTGITEGRGVDQALVGQPSSSFSNSSTMSKSGNEQLCAFSNQLPSHDSSKSPIPIISPSLSPTQSPSAPGPSNEMTGTIYPCNLCNKTFSKLVLLTQHLKSHDSKQWECDVCFKSFTTKYFLKKHKRLHTGEMPYTCAICNKSFTFQQSYHKHLLYHSDEKPHSCNECGRAFKELSTLHNHQRIHTGEKPWACETCGKCFRQRVSYLVHRRIHTGAMPYQCTVCLKSFRYKVSQRTHKCVALPAAEVATQPQSGDLLQHLLQSPSKEAEPQCCGTETSSISSMLFEEPQMLLKNQLQQMSAKQDNQNQNLNDLLHTVDSVGNSNDNSPQVMMHQGLGHQTLAMGHQSNDDRGVCLTSQPHQFGEFHSTENETMSKAVSSSNLKPCLDVNLESPSRLLQESKNVSNLSSPLSEPTPSSADFNVDILQDILSMVMSPYSESTLSPSTQMRHLSLTGQNDDDLEAGLELRQLLYGSCDSEGTP